LGAYTASRSETGLLIPSDFVNYPWHAKCFAETSPQDSLYAEFRSIGIGPCCGISGTRLGFRFAPGEGIVWRAPQRLP
jgi:hypothetical protein